MWIVRRERKRQKSANYPGLKFDVESKKKKTFNKNKIRKKFFDYFWPNENGVL